MKECPKCNSQYDDTLTYCLQDGTRLVSAEDTPKAKPQFSVPIPNVNDRSGTQNPPYYNAPETPTVISSRPPPNQPFSPNVATQPQQNPVNYVLLVILVLLLGIIGGGGLVWFLSGNSTDQSVNNERSDDKVSKKTPEKQKVEISKPDDNDEKEDIDEDLPTANTDANLEAKVEKPTGCYLTDEGKGGGEVRVRRNCDNYDCSNDASTIAGTYANRTPVTKLGTSVRSGNYVWSKVSIRGGIFWVASSKIRCE